jgi:hypothetical protein
LYVNSDPSKGPEVVEQPQRNVPTLLVELMPWLYRQEGVTSRRPSPQRMLWPHRVGIVQSEQKKDIGQGL